MWPRTATGTTWSSSASAAFTAAATAARSTSGSARQNRCSTPRPTEGASGSGTRQVYERAFRRPGRSEPPPATVLRATTSAGVCRGRHRSSCHQTASGLPSTKNFELASPLCGYHGLATQPASEAPCSSFTRTADGPRGRRGPPRSRCCRRRPRHRARRHRYPRSESLRRRSRASRRPPPRPGRHHRRLSHHFGWRRADSQGTVPAGVRRARGRCRRSRSAASTPGGANRSRPARGRSGRNGGRRGGGRSHGLGHTRLRRHRPRRDRRRDRSAVVQRHVAG